MPEFDAILFDFDGVLVDSEPVHCACWAEVLAPAGVTLDWEFYRDCCMMKTPLPFSTIRQSM